MTRQTQPSSCDRCGAKLIGEEETDPGRCIPCQRGLEVARPGAPAVVRVSQASPVVRPPSAPRYVDCGACEGSGGTTIVSLAEGEHWRDCVTCRGRGFVPNPLHEP